MRNASLKRQCQIKSLLPTSTPSQSTGLSLPKVKEIFSIDLIGTTLSFEMQREYYPWGYPSDDRPFINTITKHAYFFNPDTKRSKYLFYGNGWAIDNGKWFKKQTHGVITLQLILETPSPEEYDAYPNLFNDNFLKKWLLQFYRDREAINDQVIFTKMEDGGLQLEFRDENDVSIVDPEDVPLKKYPQLVGGMPCYIIYLNPFVIEFALPVTKRDVLHIRFQLHSQTEDQTILSSLRSETINIAQQVISTVNIKLSDDSLKDQREANTLPYKSDDLLEN